MEQLYPKVDEIEGVVFFHPKFCGAQNSSIQIQTIMYIYIYHWGSESLMGYPLDFSLGAVFI